MTIEGFNGLRPGDAVLGREWSEWRGWGVGVVTQPEPHTWLAVYFTRRPGRESRQYFLLHDSLDLVPDPKTGEKRA